MKHWPFQHVVWWICVQYLEQPVGLSVLTLKPIAAISILTQRQIWQQFYILWTTECLDDCFIKLCVGPVRPNTCSSLLIKTLLRIVYTCRSQRKKSTLNSPPYTADWCLTDYIWHLIQNVFICNVIPVHFTYRRVIGAGEVSPARIKKIKQVNTRKKRLGREVQYPEHCNENVLLRVWLNSGLAQEEWQLLAG